MTNEKSNLPDGFESRLFQFMEEDPPATIEDLKAELENSGIDPEVEVTWVNQYVSEQLAEMSRSQIRAAATKRQGVLKKLADLKEKSSAVVAKMIERLESEGEAQLDAFQAAYSKLEGPTEEDLKSMLEDWIELGYLEQESEDD